MASYLFYLNYSVLIKQESFKRIFQDENNGILIAWYTVAAQGVNPLK
jgi:hypothetical protein